MPDRILETPLSPRRLFLWVQLPFLSGLFVLSGLVVVAVPDLTGSVPLGLGILGVLTASLLFLLPTRRWMLTSAIIVIPVIDIVSIALVRAALIPYLPSVGMLCLLPFGWIAYRFRWPGLVLILASGVFITVLPFFLGASSSSTLLAVLNVTTLPVVATGISVAIHLAARIFERRRVAVRDSALGLRAALQESQEAQLLLRSVLDTVSGAVVYYNARDEFVLANSAAETFSEGAGFRLDMPPFAGPDVRMADRSTPIPLEQQVIPRALRGEVIANTVEWIGRPGSQTAIMASSRRVHRQDGTLLGTVIAAYDVTGLVEAIEVREQFLTTVSHELRTPLTSIIGYTEEIVDVLGHEAERLGIRSWLETILRNTDTLLDRVGDLLTAADPQMQLDIRRADVGSIVQRAVESHALSLERAGIALVFDVPADLHVDADASRLMQAVENVVANAAKFTARGGRIVVRAGERDDGSVFVSVADTGIGMTPDEQRRAFDRFYRAQSVRDDAIQGIGVGLSIVKSVVDGHGGHVSVESAPAEGTTVTLNIPPRSPAEVQPAP